MSSVTYHSLDQLPDTLTVFPLPGAMLFPHWHLPLNIFEPRYLNMVDDAMAGNRLIGMVQTTGGDRQKPDLAGVGCAGRITAYSETEDGRYLITLTGIARFRIAAELNVRTPYRQVRPDWAPFAHDLKTDSTEGLPPREALVSALRDYVETHDMQADWKAVEVAPVDALVQALAAGSPFSVMEKQALLEAPTLKARADMLIALLKMDSAGPDGGTLQ
ncbi:MAG TPA: LON peptidase substrate-binding domain-containing protein [Hyphomonas sp.]|nr:LON peptidase substrate-binding domain-containing protein [Hyphomonas sp.]